MASPLIGALLAFLGGGAISVLNYRINLRMLKKNPAALSSMSVVRQVLNVGYLAAVFFLTRVLPWGAAPLLLGAAAGLTLPAIALALRLAKLNDALPKEGKNSYEEGGTPHE